MTPEEKARELQTNLSAAFDGMIQRYFEGLLTIQDIRIQSLGIIDEFEKKENNAVDDITTL